MGTDHTTFEPRQHDCGTSTGDVEISPAITSHISSQSDPLTDRSIRVWSAGDHDRISRGFRHEAEVFVDRLELAPGTEVLDSACDTGNLAIQLDQGTDVDSEYLEVIAVRRSAS